MPLGVFDPQWLPDGSGIVFASPLFKGHLTIEATTAEIERREKDPVKAHITEDRVFRFWDTWLTTGEVPHVFLYDLATEKLRDITPDATVWFDWMEPGGQYDVAPDGKEIVLSGITLDPETTLMHTLLYTAPITGGSLTCITPDHPAEDLRPRYTPDGKSIVYGMTHDPYFYADRVRVMAYDRATRAHTELITGWDRSPAHWTIGRDGTISHGGREPRAHRAVRLEGNRRAVPIVRGGTVTGVDAVVRQRCSSAAESLDPPPSSTSRVRTARAPSASPASPRRWRRASGSARCAR